MLINKPQPIIFKKIKIPAFLILGAKRHLTPLNEGKRIDNIWANSKLVVLENSSHVPMKEYPKESLDVFIFSLN